MGCGVIKTVTLPPIFFNYKHIMKEIILAKQFENRELGEAWFCHVFVYSNKGNFVLKGLSKECKNYLKEFVEDGGKYFCNWTYFVKEYFLTMKDNPSSKLKLKRTLDESAVAKLMVEDKVELAHESTHWNCWRFWKDNVYIDEPDLTDRTRYDIRKENGKDFLFDYKKYQVYQYADDNSGLCYLRNFKRLPKKWIKEFDNI